jgi:hypothetical protein
MNTEKQVPLGAEVRVWKRMEPPFFSMMPLLIQRPSPVPRSPLVEKKGLKSWRLMLGGMPGPESPTETRIPLILPVLQSCVR